MSSIRDFKKFLSGFEAQVKELSVELTGIFRIGKPLPPKERMAKVNQFLKLAHSVLRFKPLLDDLEQIVERAEKDRENFARVNRLSSQDEENKWSVEEEEPTNAM